MSLRRFFLTILACTFCTALRAQTPDTIIVFKLAETEQTGPATQVPGLPGYGVAATFPTAIPATAQVRLDGPSGSVALTRDAPNAYSRESYFFDETALQNALPNGAYALAVSSGGVDSNTPISLAIGPLPRATTVTNFDALQNWTGGPLTLTWQAFPGGTRDDLVTLTVYRADDTEIYSSPVSGTPGGLDGTSTSFTLPALNAVSGEKLYVHLGLIQFTFGFANGGNTIVATGRGVNLKFPITRRLPAPPAIAAQPRSQTIAAGSSVAFSAGTTGADVTYQWRRNGLPIAGATSPTYLLTGAATSAAGSYTVAVTNAGGTTISDAAQLTVIPAAQAPVRISNLSIRSQAGTGAETLIVGFAIGGTSTGGAKPLLLRAVGPALSGFGVPNVLSDPRLEIYQGLSRISENDNWGGEAQVAAISAQVGAFSLGAATTRDAALYNPAFATSGYTMQITGPAGASGVVLAEIYDATGGAAFAAGTPRLINVSARTRVGTNSDVLIAGFIVDGPAAKTVLIRGIGPTLGAFGVPGALADPQLEVFSGSTLVQGNDNWGGDSTLPATFLSVGAFPLNSGSRDAALIVTLPPGGYTARISGVGSTTGIGLVELYEVP